MNSKRDHYKDVLLGVAAGDAVGVPYEFRSREHIEKNPATGMTGYGTYNLPPGTWSDDSSLTFCLAEALASGFDLKVLAGNFRDWYYESYWTPHGEVFDIGITTRNAISALSKVARPELAGDSDEQSNGNGSLMRILPLVFYLGDKSEKERFEITRKASSITHGHVRSAIACHYYLEFAQLIIHGMDKFDIYSGLQKRIPPFLKSIAIGDSEIRKFDRLSKSDIRDFEEERIFSSGYVLHTLEASIWCLLTTDNYRDAVLKAVNLGEDTDTTAAVTGGLAGLLYGHETIPASWKEKLARYADIEDLAFRMRENSNTSEK